MKNAAPSAVEKDAFNTVALRAREDDRRPPQVEPQSVFYPAAAAGPPWAVTIREDVNWREFGIIEWQVK